MSFSCVCRIYRAHHSTAPQCCHSRSSEMQGWTEDSYGCHSVNTVQTCTSKSVRSSSTFALQSHKERPWSDLVGMASHRRWREAQPEGSLRLPWLIFKLSGAPCPRAEQRAGYTAASGLDFPAVHHWWDNHCPSCCISAHLLWQERCGAPQPAQPVIISVTVWYFLQRSTAYTVCTCCEGGATIL